MFEGEMGAGGMYISVSVVPISDVCIGQIFCQIVTVTSSVCALCESRTLGELRPSTLVLLCISYRLCIKALFQLGGHLTMMQTVRNSWHQFVLLLSLLRFHVECLE